jgi:hypothetical protein
MDTNRKTALLAGLLFICATAASLAGTAIEQPVLNGADYLTNVSGNAKQVSAGGLLELIAAGTSVAIAIALYPVLRNRSTGLALGSVVFRTIEAVMYAAAAASLLSLLTVSQTLTHAAIADRVSLQAIGDFLLGLRREFTLFGVFAFTVGAFMYYSVFFQSRLIPRWLSGWGIVALLLLLVASLSSLFSGNPVTTYVILILPIAAQEMVLAVWLIAKGFSSGAVQRGSASAIGAGLTTS